MATINEIIAQIGTLQHKGRMLAAQAGQCEHKAEFLRQCVEEARALGVADTQDITAYMTARKKAEAQALAQKLTPEAKVDEDPTRPFTDDEAQALCDKVRKEFETDDKSGTLALLVDYDRPGRTLSHLNKQGVREYEYHAERALRPDVYRAVRRELGKSRMNAGFHSVTDIVGLVLALCAVPRGESIRDAIID